ncbi:uncharacterized protein LOC124350647 [Daphnia pulicaria]|uniref:uncharacterized protein LOC124350647 n=1 Tax=Daphnia pulicaria TaxID=35523 RepID=UPI001EEB4618|nr:uncharacterized protein LOC124350647 [Daphnia pulicaria]
MFIRLCWMMALFLLLTSAVSSMNIPATECKRDADCTVGNYCLFSMCETCLPCEQVFYRRSPVTVNGRIGCARTADDCGVCLPGYQSEDLTGQRHSMKCYPNQSEPPADYLSDVNTIGSTVTSIIICAILATLAAGSCFVYVKHRKVETTRPAVDDSKDESRNLVDRLPPPYEDPEEPANCILASEPVYTRVIVQQDVLNQATPIHYYHRHPKVESPDMDEDNANLPGAEPPIEDGNGSTETIPSLWEPNSVLDLHVDVPESNCTPRMNTILIRSQSLDLLTHHPHSHAVLTASRSDPTLPTDSRRRRSSGGESYAHRHVRLSMHRLPTTPVVSPAEQNSFIDPAHNVPQSRSTDQCQEDCEPTEPQAFVFDDSQVSANVSYENDINLSTSILSFTGSLYGHQISSSTPTETGRGSQDSGFFDQSRRRPATDELSFGLALFVKRPREFE